MRAHVRVEEEDREMWTLPDRVRESKEVQQSPHTRARSQSHQHPLRQVGCSLSHTSTLNRLSGRFNAQIVLFPSAVVIVDQRRRTETFVSGSVFRSKARRDVLLPLSASA